MTNVKRSVERLEGVAKVTFDLNRGVGTVTFGEKQQPTVEDLWHAIVESGFTPTKIELDGQEYKGPEE